MLDGRWRAKAERGLDPIGRALHRIGVSADALTIFGLLVAIGTAALIANGNLALAVIGVILTGLPDLLDGSVARHSGTAGSRGAFLDSVCDRVADSVLLAGVAWHLTDESANAPVLALGVLALSLLVSYERAKAEALGFSARGGVMERFERLVLLGVGLTFDILMPVLWVMLVLTAVTALHRFAMVWRQASPSERPAISDRMRTRFVRSHRARRYRPRRLSRVSRRR
ncbi:MAG: CDP-alcohol phosphatidyltransferase family protein [Actinobacteria bacterium]|nr:CDP-alcohol phosphatidyltransferase family protein [Actinomycetota bacterium]